MTSIKVKPPKQGLNSNQNVYIYLRIGFFLVDAATTWAPFLVGAGMLVLPFRDRFVVFFK